MGLPPLAQDYAPSWYTIDGVGTSTGGPYVVTGTIGRPDADWYAGDKYDLPTYCPRP